MIDLTEDGWRNLESIGNQAGLRSERVGALKSRLSKTDRPGAPYLLLIGRANCGIDLLVERFFGQDIRAEISGAEPRPFVIGPNPKEVRPALGIWPGKTVKNPFPGHCVLAQISGEIRTDTFAELTSVGFFDLAVFVTRLSQPLNMTEREVISRFSGAAATLRVLVVGLPGEEPPDGQMKEMQAYAAAQLRQAGFRDGRFLGTEIWFTDGRRRGISADDLKPTFTTSIARSTNAFNLMAESAICTLILEIKQMSDTAKSQSNGVELSANDQDRLANELSTFLASIRIELENEIRSNPIVSVETLRSSAIQRVRNWGSYMGSEGAWLRYVERVRPGAQKLLFAETASVLSTIRYESLSPPTIVGTSNAKSESILVTVGKRVCVSVLIASLAYVATSSLLTSSGTSTGLPPLVTALISYAALLAGGFAGYGVSTILFRAASIPEVSVAPQAAPISKLQGWEHAEAKLLSWFREQLKERGGTTVQGRLGAFMKQFDIQGCS